MASILPIELVEHAIDFLHNDVHALTACALASRTLLLTARFHIWRELTLPVQAHPLHVRMQGLLEILDCNANIAPLVRSLTVSGMLSLNRQSRKRRREYWNNPTGTMLLWEKLPNLRVLKFVHIRFRMGLHQLLPVAYSLPNLEEIAVVGSIAILPREYWNRPSYRDSVVSLNAPPKLRRFSVTGGSTAWSFLEDLAKLLLEPEMHAPLEALDLSCITNSDNSKYAARDRTDTLPSQAWASIIASLGLTLRECTLGLLEVECYSENIANLYESLKQCTRLQSLSIKCNVLIHSTYHHPFVFIDMLADVLSSGLHPPFPELETLSIEWHRAPEPVPPGCADACKKLAIALEDRSRYPLLKRLNVAASTNGGTSERSAVQREEIAAQEPVLRSCLERVTLVGVQLDISAA